MRNIALVTKIDGAINRKCFVDLDKIVGVEVASNGKEIRLYFDNATWYIPSDEYEYIMSLWSPNYLFLREYKALKKEE